MISAAAQAHLSAVVELSAAALINAKVERMSYLDCVDFVVCLGSRSIPDQNCFLDIALK